MGKFLDPLDVRAYGKNEWILLVRYAYKTNIFDPEKYITITAPRGFINDLASIPRLFQSLIPKVGRHRGAAVIHDWLYYKRGQYSLRRKLTRKQCDQVFLDGMKTANVWWLRRWTMYQAVRAGGWVYWRKKPKNDRVIELK